jgi:hypothetical protein
MTRSAHLREKLPAVSRCKHISLTLIGEFSELRMYGVLRSSRQASAGGIMPAGKGNEVRRLRVMRAFVMVEPKFLTPPELFPTLLEGFVAWRDANREHMESFEFFAGGGGGFGIINGPDEATLNRIMVQYPFFPYSEITVRPILDGDTALEQWREIMSEGMGAGPAV